MRLDHLLSKEYKRTTVQLKFLVLSLFFWFIFFLRFLKFKPKAVRLTKRKYQNDSIKEKGARKTPKIYTVVKKHFGGVAQLGEHLPCKQGVRSSNLLISTKEPDN